MSQLNSSTLHAMALSSLLLLLLLLFFFFIIFVQGQCLDDKKKLLLDLKSEFILNSTISEYMVRWNQTDDDCCHWGGVSCDEAGHVISLNLPVEGISGRIGESSSLFRLTYLSGLELSFNDFSPSQIPMSIHRLTNLRLLGLSYAGFTGPIPSTLANLTALVSLDLSHNSLTGSIPSMLANLTELVSLNLSENSLTASIPSFHMCNKLENIDLSHNSLTASIPSFHMCNKLENIDLSYNNLMGSLSDLHFEGLTNLYLLDLSNNSLNGNIPHHLFCLPSIYILRLSHNQFSGRITELPILNHSELYSLDMSGNMIEGPIPNFFFQLQNLSDLWLDDNMFDGTFKLQKIQGLPRLERLDLSHNNLSVETANMNSSSYGFPQLYWLGLSSCNLYDFPDLRNQSSLLHLDLSNNRIGGDIPSWIWKTQMFHLNLSHNLLTDLQKPYFLPDFLHVLDLRSNQLRSVFPLLPQANHSNLLSSYFLLANNSLTGVIPTSICNASYQFVVLDLSFNNLSGSIPPCLLKKDIVKDVLNLRNNNFTGVIPDQFPTGCGIRTFDVSDNNLGGKIPKSLANCKGLKVMNVGNNNFDDSFPCMLPSSLHILVLRSNRFHGDLTCHQSWLNLQILDISSNNFSGTLDPLNLSSLRGMMLQSPAHLRPNRSDSHYLSPNRFYRDEVTLTVKRIEMKLVKIWPDFTSIDLSCNHFEGDIPHAIGNLTSLYLLNLSHNALTSTIPTSLGALTELGSLDLSANQLRGRVPEELAQLTFLSILNVSHNHLTGKIPTGPQFQTFSPDSFEGNTGLCGFPLDRSCSKSTHGSGSTPSKSEHEEIEWEYVFAALGYAVGLGIIAWTLLCCRSLRERYFEKIEEVVDKILYERAQRRRHERRVEMRHNQRG